MKTKVLCIGHVTLDTFFSVENAELHCDINSRESKVCFDFGAKIPVEDVAYGVGGGAANVSAALGKMETEPILCSILGEDPVGESVIKRLVAHNVNIDHLIKDEYPTDQAAVISYITERTIFTYNHDREYNLEKFASLNPAEYEWILVSSVGEKVELLYKQIIKLKEQNSKLKLFYNPGSKELNYSYEQIQLILPYVDYLLSNVEEGCVLLNRELSRNDIELKDLLKLLATEKGIKNVVLTDAKEGVYYREFGEGNADIIHLNAIKTEVVEKTGAGDAFSAGFIAGIINGKEMMEASKWGIANSTSVIKKVGAQNGLLDLNLVKMLSQKVTVGD